MTKRVFRDCPIPNCGAEYLVRLSNHLTDVHGSDYINRRTWLQEAKLQPKVRVMIYPGKRSQGLKPTTTETPLSRGVRKAANNIKHCKTTVDSVPEWLTLYGDDEGQTRRTEISNPACSISSL